MLPYRVAAVCAERRLQKQINTLNETNKLILQELQAIRKVLEQPADLTKHAEALQLNVGQFQTCLDSGRYAADAQADRAEAAKAGISRTPAYADYKAAIEASMPAGGGAGTR